MGVQTRPGGPNLIPACGVPPRPASYASALQTWSARPQARQTSPSNSPTSPQYASSPTYPQYASSSTSLQYAHQEALSTRNRGNGPHIQTLKFKVARAFESPHAHVRPQLDCARDYLVAQAKRACAQSARCELELATRTVVDEVANTDTRYLSTEPSEMNLRVVLESHRHVQVKPTILALNQKVSSWVFGTVRTLYTVFCLGRILRRHVFSFGRPYLN
jgi:hypothetical protein